MVSSYRNITSALKPGPVAIVINEDGVELVSTLAHHAALGFENIILLGEKPASLKTPVIHLEGAPQGGLDEIVNPLLGQLQNRWVLPVYNAEYFYFPFCEQRAISDAIQFVDEENRSAVYCTVLDLYAADCTTAPNAVDATNAHFDSQGYYAHDRFDGPQRLERQKQVFGGLKWRYAQHIPWARQSIDRIALFRALPDVRLTAEFQLSDAEMNTVSCPWHHSLTGAVASFRVAKSLRHNPGSQFEVESFMWSGSTRFEWTSTQLMDHGFIEPGQWF
jgi:hypothetical protein